MTIISVRAICITSGNKRIVGCYLVSVGPLPGAVAAFGGGPLSLSAVLTVFLI